MRASNYLCSFLACKRFILVGVVRTKKNYLKGSPMGDSLGSTVLDLESKSVNTLRTGLLNCLNARSRGLTFRHCASCI